MTENTEISEGTKHTSRPRFIDVENLRDFDKVISFIRSQDRFVFLHDRSTLEISGALSDEEVAELKLLSREIKVRSEYRLALS